jgi:hypothetical protein
MNKKILVVLGVFIAGFLSSRMMTSHAPVENSAQCENLSEAKNDLISISQNEYLEYTQIKDLKQKYEKADELLGKVMLLFLADIGFKATKMSTNEMEVQNLETKSETSNPENPKVAVASGNPVQQQQMKIIEGSFAGEIKFLIKNAKLVI